MCLDNETCQASAVDQHNTPLYDAPQVGQSLMYVTWNAAALASLVRQPTWLMMPRLAGNPFAVQYMS